MSHESFAVIVAQPQKPDFASVGKSIAEFRQIPLQDGLHLARAKWGVMEEELRSEQALQLVSILKNNGVESKLVSQAHLAKATRAVVVPHARWINKELEISLKHDEWRVIPKSTLLMMAVAVFKLKTIHHTQGTEGPSAGEKMFKTGVLLATGIPLPTARKKKIEQKKEEIEIIYVLDIFSTQFPYRFRFSPATFDYRFLKEKMQFNSELNFRALLTQLREQMPDVLRNHGLNVLLNGQSLQTMGYENESDFDQECRWLLTLASNPKPT